ncbi:hypothetical protein GUK30_10295 [Rhizobium leguminosarum]|uniref:hypothetical protein n=1 Tax=Rhizobium ruizarguesonis TaxID=2081791 RepID=UPI0013C0F7E0|nr:hypothetical protein [Rhizobium ruizarguesonis]NEI19802.1 hypothetical protein [Rhizobium ruizarguesonis]
MTDEQMRATLAALKKIKANDNGSPWVDEKIPMYEEEVARRLLLNGAQPFQPFPDRDGMMVINALGDRENDF